VRVADVMRTGDQIPRVAAGTLLTDALAEMGAKRMGMTCVVDAQGRAQGIFTDGDLRRLLGQNQLTPDLTVDQVMTRSAQTISAEALATEAAHQMDATRINHLLIVDDQRVLIGAIGLHDLLEAKIL
jgi:arabinose-5-phosphate isomerase